jgi:uncharacterized membrane protein YgcG
MIKTNGPELAAKIFAKKVHDSWRVGHEECNDGAIVFLSIEDRRSYISTGAGLRNVLPGETLAYL